MQTDFSISQLIEAATVYLQQCNYSYGSIIKYVRYWKRLEKVCTQYHINLSDFEECSQAVKREWEISDLRKATDNQRFQLRTLKCLSDFLKTGTFGKYYRITSKIQSASYLTLIDDFFIEERKRGISARTLKSAYSVIRHFLEFIYLSNGSRIEDLQLELLKQYVHELGTSNFSPCTKARDFSIIKNFLIFLENQNLVQGSLSYYLKYNSFGRYKKLCSHYSEQEIKQLLEKIDRSSRNGKRDYLILLFGVQLGIRASDIRNLKLENVDISTKTLRFCQQKTGNLICLPLDDAILIALADYVRYARYPSGTSWIFLKTCAPYTPYAESNVFYYVLNKYLKAAGIDCTGRKRGLHTLRHSLAGNLLELGIGLPTISGILGHSSTATTMGYTKISYQQLKTAALEVPYER